MKSLKIDRRAVVVGAAMIAASGLAVAARPTRRIADEGPRVDLEATVPERFGDWRIDPSIVPVALSPEVQAKLDKYYNQTLARTYINGRGQRIMLSIAYGGDQASEETQVHRPEFCYVAQGFTLSGARDDRIVTPWGPLPARRLNAVQGPRREPITYWVRIGDRATLPGIGRKLTQITYGLRGTVPDGMLVRVSSISSRPEEAYVLHDDFTVAMLGAADQVARARLAGTFAA